MRFLQDNDVAETAGYRGLQCCGSVWHCPVCASRVSNERCGELLEAVRRAQEKGWRVLLVTYTAKHGKKTLLKDQLSAMTKAYQAVWRGEPIKRIKERFGVLGVIRTLECTHGKKNGWHPHIHSLIFIKEDANIAAFGEKLKSRWERMAEKQGLTMNEHGFDLRDSTKEVAEYIAKWGHDPKWREADELARWHTKRGKPVRGIDGHYTPWQLLDFADHGDRQAGELFREYALTYHGRRQLHWSNGLREALGMGKELTDEEVAQKHMEDSHIVYQIYLTERQWSWIKGNDLRVELLELVNACNADSIVGACQREYGFEPQLHLPELEERSELTDEDREMLKTADVLRVLQSKKDVRVLTPFGAGVVSVVARCPILKRWRCSVFLEGGGAINWRVFDVSQVSLVA
jgi:hypothetical protein